MKNNLQELIDSGEIKVCLPGDRACAHWYGSYYKGQKAKAEGRSCECGGEWTLSPHLLVDEELWDRGWKGEPIPQDIIDFCKDI
jgi:hypothetical protein